MSTCHRIQKSVTAYIDGESSESERVAIDQHVEECPACAKLVKEQRELASELFKQFSDHKLSRNLRKPVLRHLPEMDMTAREVEAVNYRAKHPRSMRERFAKVVPLLAGSIVVVLGLVVSAYWPEEDLPADTIAVVAQASGKITHIARGETKAEVLRPLMAIRSEDTLIAGGHSVLLGTIAEGSRLTLGEDSRAMMLSPRQVRLEHGRVYLDVSSGEELFRVNTAEATVTVFGTAFEVACNNGETLVTVERGVVFVESVSDPTRFRSVYANEQVATGADFGPSEPVQVDASAWVAWATSVTPERDALDVFARHFGPVVESEDHEGIPHFLSATRNVNSVRIAWDPATSPAKFHDYTVYVSEYGGDSLARHRVDGSTFNQTAPRYKEKVYYTVPLDPDVLSGRGLIDVKVVPDTTTGSAAPSDLVVLFTVP